MKQRLAAAPYAKALFALAKERDQADLVGRELAEVVRMYERSPDAREFFSRPSLPPAAKRTAALELAKRSGLLPITGDFLALVAERRRTTHLSEIARLYERLRDADLGRARVRVRSAVPLTAEQRERLTAKLMSTFGVQRVVLEDVEDPSVVGGFIAENDTMVIDGSLAGELDAMRHRLEREG